MHDSALFYHAFPNKRDICDADAGLPLGLGILDSIIFGGLLLTTEDLVISRNPDSLAQVPPTTRLLQRRACFTHMERHAFLAASSHRETFGNFAIGLATDKARLLGILPTFYYYRRSEDGHASNPSLADGGISQEIMFRLSELRRLMITVAHIEARREPKGKWTKSVEYLSEAKLTVDDEHEISDRLAALTGEDATRICEVLETDRVPAWNLAEWIELILAVFQTADSRTLGQHLGYYAQREWRLVHMFTEGLVSLPLSLRRFDADPMLQPGLRPHVERIRRSIERLLSDERRLKLDDCYVVCGRDNAPFRNFIEDIIAPKEVAAEISGLLRKAGMLAAFRKSTIGNDVLFSRSHPHRD